MDVLVFKTNDTQGGKSTDPALCPLLTFQPVPAAVVMMMMVVSLTRRRVVVNRKSIQQKV